VADYRSNRQAAAVEEAEDNKSVVAVENTGFVEEGYIDSVAVDCRIGSEVEGIDFVVGVDIDFVAVDFVANRLQELLWSAQGNGVERLSVRLATCSLSV
jgi:hypothetical protein